MGGLGGSYGGTCTSGGYTIGFVTGSVGSFERIDALEAVLRDCLGLPRQTEVGLRCLGRASPPLPAGAGGLAAPVAPARVRPAPADIPCGRPYRIWAHLAAGQVQALVHSDELNTHGSSG